MSSSRSGQVWLPPPAHSDAFSLSPDDLEKLKHVELNIEHTELDFEIMARRRKIIRDVIYGSSDEATKLVPRDLVIAFMDAVVKEHQYVVLKKYLTKECKIIKHYSTLDAIYDKLIKGHEKFQNFDEDAIWKALDQRISEVRSRHKALKIYHFRNYLHSFESIKWDSDISEDLQELGKRNFRGMNSDDKEKELWYYKRSLFRAYTIGLKGMDIFAPRFPPEKEDLYERRDLISDLVFQTLEEDYVMDPDPEVELVKIKMHNPIYDDFIIEDPAGIITTTNGYKRHRISLASNVVDDPTSLLKLLLKYWYYSQSKSKVVSC